VSAPRCPLAENGEMTFGRAAKRQAHELDCLAHTFLTVSKFPISAGYVE
jgi:hypothetical protein